MWKLSALVVLALAIVAMTSLICIDSDDSSAVRHATFEVDGIRYSYTQDDLYEPYTTKIGDGANPVIANDVESFTIPSSVEYDGEVYEIEGIGTDAFKNCTNLKSVTIPSSIKVIGKNAFWGCTGLTEFTIPATVREIGSNAFMLCSNLAELTISEGVQTIKQAAFQNCDKLTSITIPSTMSTIGTGAFELCDLLESVVISPGVTKISDSMFSACPALSSVSIPSTVESIGSYAFGSCRALESITIPEGVVTIGSYAFQHCTALKSIVLPSTANSLSYSMLRNCSALETVSVLGNPTLVRELCFAYCTSLRTVNIPDSVETIGNKAFIECSSLQSIVIPEGVTMIGESAFEKCSSMRAAEIPSTIVEFTDRAFYGCSSLQSISIPTGTTTLGDSVFRACTSLTEVTVPGNVTTPGDHLFTGCTSLVSAVLCEGVSCASGSMFEGCTSLRIVTFATTVDTIKGSAFYGCSSLSRRTAGDAQIGEPTTSGTFKIPDSVETIGNKAFYGCSSIKHLTIPRSVTTVSGQTFSNCTSLMEVLVPSTITNMNSFYMFSGCTALEIVEIKEGVSTVGKGMFYGCTSLISVSIREGVETIGERAFYDCISLMDMRIPDSVTTIENKAFENVCMPGGAIPAAGVTVGHQYVCAYDFNNDFSNCDITLTCENDSDHAVSRTVIPVIDNEANEATARLKHGVRIYSKTVPLEIVLPAPTADGRSYVYSGEEQTFVLNGFDSELMTMRDGRQTDAGTYTVTVSIKEGSNAVWSPEVQSDPTYVFTIDKKPITELIISIGELVYTGSSQDAVVTVDGGKAHLNDDFTISGTASAVGAGSYTLTVTAADDGNYIGSDDKTWSIGRKTLTISPVDVNVPIGTATPEYSADGDGFVEGEGMEDLNGTAAFECGYTSGSIVGATHAISVTGYASDNYTILYDTGTLTVVKARLTAPLATKDVFVFNGEEQTYVPIGFDSNTMVIAGNTRTDAGSQTVTVSIRSPGTYDWDNIIDTDIDFQFTIDPKQITSEMISPCDIVFDDSMKTAAVTVDGGLARPNIDYTLSGETAATEVGTYTITITAEKNGNYIGSAEKVWSIVKAKPAESPEGGYVCESEDGTAFIGGESMSKIVKDANNSGDTTLSIISDEITVAFDSDAIVSLGTDPITLTQTKLDKEKAGAAWEIFGDNPVIYDISLGEPRDFGSGLVKITIPYTLGEGEKPEGLKILYVVDGVVQEEIPCTYSDGKVTFQTSHLSVYGVKYTEPEGDGGSSGLPVTGIVIGAVAALALIGAAVLLIKRRSA